MDGINNINEQQQKHIANKSTGRQDSGSASFKEAFNRAIEKPDTSKMETAKTNSLNEPAPRHFRIDDTAPPTFSGKADKLLDMLDLYSEELKRSDVSLKQIAPVLEQIKTEAEALLQEAESSPDADPQQKRIAREFAVTANTEYMKFQRGDYLS